MALVLAVMTLTIVALLGATTHADAVGQSDGVDVVQVTDPLPSQLYALTGHGVVETALIWIAPAWCRVEDAHLFDFCADTMLPAFEDGRDTGRLPETIEGADPALAVRFAPRCLAPGPHGGPGALPAPRDASFWTSIKLGLGLADRQPAPPVLIGAAG